MESILRIRNRPLGFAKQFAVSALVAPILAFSTILGTVAPSIADDVEENTDVVAEAEHLATEVVEPEANVVPQDASLQEGVVLGVDPETNSAESTTHLEERDAQDAKDENLSSSENEREDPSEGIEADSDSGVIQVEVPVEAQGISRSARAASDFVECTPGVVYSLQENGKIAMYKGSPTGFFKEMSIDGIGSWANSNDEYPYLNGLAVTANKEIYANNIRSNGMPSGSPPSYPAVVGIMYHNGTQWSTKEFNLFNFDDSTAITKNELIFGAFNKNDGKYYFGGYKKNSQTSTDWHIQLYKYSDGDAAPEKVGTIPVGSTTNQNGDIAFDNNGNLYLVTGPKDTPEYRVITITKNSLESANGGKLKYTSTPTMSLPSSFNSGFGGLAFDAKGQMYLGASSKIVKANPTTGKLLDESDDPYATTDHSSDLASCGHPPTITLLKDLPEGRIRTSDQFVLTLYQPNQPTDGTQVYGQTTTQGDKSGIQANQVGPLPINVPGTYKFGEQMADGSGSVLDAYSKTFKCVQEGKKAPIAEGLLGQDGKTSVFVSYNPDNPANVVCTITNRKTPPKVDLTLTKKGLPGESSLDGALFQLWLDDGNGTFDNGDPDQKINDAVFTSNEGRIVWEGLDPGKYWVEEKAAPNGYYIFDDNPVLVDLSEGKNLSIEVNNRKLGSVAWRKVDGGNKLLAGSKWKLVGPDPDATEVAVTDCVTGEPTCPDSYLDRDPDAGEFKVEGLKWGSYTLVETNAPAGYQLDSSEHSFTIDAKTVDFVFDEGFVNEQTTYDASLIKKDVDSEQVLSGAVFQLYEDTNNTGNFDTGDQLIAGSSKTSGADGKITWTGLSAGTYFAEETAAPAGYQLLSGPVVIVVPQETVVEVPNEKSSVPDLPLTGGLGSDLFIVLGGLCAGSGGLLLGLMWRQRKRAMA